MMPQSEFFLEPADYVTRTGKIFEIGDYPDKGFTLTESEADAAIAAFQPVPLDLEHTPTILDGKLGTLKRVWRDGASLFGETELASWLDARLTDDERKVSCTWDRERKTLAKLALVRSPRVSDAVLMSAYSDFAMTRHNTPEGQMAIQEIHDRAASAGAVCDRKNVQMASAHESTAIQKIHDMAATHGATCSKGDAPAWARANYSQQNTDESHTAQSANRTAQSAKGDKPMTAWQKFTALFADGTPTKEQLDQIDPAEFAPATTANFADSPEAKAMQARLDALEAERVAAAQSRRAQDAASFAQGEIDACRAVPAEKPFLIAAFNTAARDDDAEALSVTFSVGDETREVPSRVELLRALCAARTPHALTTEVLFDASGKVMFDASGRVRVREQTPGDGPMSAERRAELLNLTPMGREILKAK